MAPLDEHLVQATGDDGGHGQTESSRGFSTRKPLQFLTKNHDSQAQTDTNSQCCEQT
jgi:hypothetical protein